MPKFEDKNGVTWDIRVTSTTVDPGTTTGAFSATVDDASPKDYAGQTTGSDFEPLGHPGERVIHPAGGNPMLRGPGAEAAAQNAIMRFAQQDAGKPENQRAIQTRKAAQGAGASSSSVLPIVLLVALVLILDSKKGR